jgi:hypothetical protein
MTRKMRKTTMTIPITAPVSSPAAVTGLVPSPGGEKWRHLNCMIAMFKIYLCTDKQKNLHRENK